MHGRYKKIPVFVRSKKLFSYKTIRKFIPLVKEIAAMLIVLPASILINRGLGAEDRGIVAFILLIPSIASTVMLLGWDRTVRKLAAESPDKLPNIYAQTNRNVIWMSGLGVAWGLIIYQLQDNISGNVLYVSIIFLPALIALPIIGTSYLSMLSGIGKTAEYYSVRVYSSLTYLIVAAFFYFSNITIASAIVAIVALWFSTVLLSYLYLKKEIANKEVDISICVDAPSFFKSSPSYFLEVVAMQSPVYFLTNFCGMRETGSFVSFRIFELPITSLVQWITNTMLMNLSNKSLLDLRKFADRSTIILLFIGACGAVIAFNVAYLIVDFALGPTYLNYVWVIPIMIMSASMYGAASINLNIIHTGLGFYKFYRFQAGDAVLKITLYFIGSIFFGFEGFICAWAVVAALSLIITRISLF